MRILVVGHLGFIGKHVFSTLRNPGHKHEVIGLDWPDLVQHISEEQRQSVDVIVNLAAIGGVSRAARNPALVMSNNVAATAALRAWADTEIQPPLVVQVSSFSVYGEASTPTLESNPKRPKEIYGASKLAQELCWAGYGGSVAILRLSSVYGSGMRLDDPEATVVAKIAKAARDETVFKINEDGQQVRDFVHVYDVADTIRRTIEMMWASPATGMWFECNVCSGVGTSIEEACKLLGAKYEITGEKREGDMRVCLGDNKRMCQLNGHPPMTFGGYGTDALKP